MLASIEREAAPLASDGAWLLLAELNLDLLLARRNTSKTFKALPAFRSENPYAP